jgi:purine-binding chemotaxis protein CheW
MNVATANQSKSRVAEPARDYVTATIAGQLFGIPVLSVQDVLGAQRLTRIPLAPPEVAGALNLRGRIVTAIDLRKRLGVAGDEKAQSGMSIVVEYAGELYSLLIDTVGEVLNLPADRYEPNPPTLDSRWREVSGGIYRLDGQLMVILEVDRVLDFSRAQAA